MKFSRFQNRLLATTVLAGAFIAVPAHAQSAGPEAPVASQPAGATPSDNPTTAGPVEGTASAPVGAPVSNADGSVSQGNEIVVTGSRIANANAKSISPIQVVNAAEFRLQGETRVENILNNLPQVSASDNSTDNNGASGIATVDLRDLGNERTLVLINGRRLGPGDAQEPVADLNFIPSALIQRVEVLTGGASSVYGSDAIAGVVNFIMNKNFEGIQLDGQYSLDQHNNDAGPAVTDALQGAIAAAQARNHNAGELGFGFPRGNTVDGGQKNVALTIGAGTADDRGHVVLYGTWRKQAGITQAARDYSECGLSLTSDTTFFCPGSSTTSPARFRDLTNIGTVNQPVYAPTGGSVTLDPNNPGGIRGFLNTPTASDGYNFNPINLLQRPDERYTLGGFAHYKVSDALDPYLEVMFMDDHTAGIGAPGGSFYGGVNNFVNCNSPLLQDVPSTDPALAGATQRQFICGAAAGTGTVAPLYIGRRNIEGGGRISDIRHTDYRITAGVKGDIGHGWTYDAYGLFSRALLQSAYLQDVSARKLQNSLLTTTVGGKVVCQSAVPNAAGLVTDPKCVPYDIFSGNPVSQAAIDYISEDGFQRGSTTEYVASGSVSGDLGTYGLQSPFADHGVGVAFGAEYRRDALKLENDASYLDGDLLGAGLPFGQPDANGTTTVREFFGELSIPLVSDKPFFRDLTLNASYRYSKYNLSGQTDAYKFGAEWAPIDWVRFRGGYNRAVRAPNVYDLFSPAYIVLTGTTDPCAGAFDTDDAGNSLGTVNGNTLAQCRNSFFTTNAAGNRVQTTPDTAFGSIDPNPAQQYNGQNSGNSGLKPEIADTYTVGVVLTPTFLRGFTMSVDGYDIRIKQTISALSPDFVLNSCVSTANPFFCNAVNRAQGSGSLWYGNGYTNSPSLNLGALRTRGIDVAASYRMNLEQFFKHDIGSLAFNFSGTYVDKLETTPVSGANSVGKFDCAGQYGITCGTPVARWRHQLRVTYAGPQSVQVSVNWRYTSHVKFDGLSTNPLLNVGGYDGDEIDTHIKAYNLFDLSFSVPVADKFTFRVGADNVLDKTPPIISTGEGGSASNTFPGNYDSLGRYIYAGFSINL